MTTATAASPESTVVLDDLERRIVNAYQRDFPASPRPYAVIENVVTRKERRREGHGQGLMAALIEACWERGCYKIMLLSGLARPEAHRFYEEVGFDRRAKQAFVLRRPQGR